MHRRKSLDLHGARRVVDRCAQFVDCALNVAIRCAQPSLRAREFARGLRVGCCRCRAQDLARFGDASEVEQRLRALRREVAAQRQCARGFAGCEQTLHEREPQRALFVRLRVARRRCKSILRRLAAASGRFVAEIAGCRDAARRGRRRSQAALRSLRPTPTRAIWDDVAFGSAPHEVVADRNRRGSHFAQQEVRGHLRHIGLQREHRLQERLQHVRVELRHTHEARWEPAADDVHRLAVDAVVDDAAMRAEQMERELLALMLGRAFDAQIVRCDGHRLFERLAEHGDRIWLQQ